MKCNQTGKLFQVKVTVLSRVDESLTQDDLAEGSQLLMTNDKKSYPVSVQRLYQLLVMLQLNVRALCMNQVASLLYFITENSKSGSKNS